MRGVSPFLTLFFGFSWAVRSKKKTAILKQQPERETRVPDQGSVNKEKKESGVCVQDPRM